jgi:N-formylglutamate deformylase
MTITHTLKQGRLPLLVSMPHVGTHIPDELTARYVSRALGVEDTDWHLHRLYGFVETLGASVLVPHVSRYVIDLNRPPDDAPMYPGASNTELCPTRFFTGDPLYLAGQEPDADERIRRRSLYWQPYHDALSAELARIKQVHGFALLWDAHSIRSEIPWLFEGKLPDFNLGTASGDSAHAQIAQAALTASTASDSFSAILNGRFKGGYITRRYGQPEQDVHAIQLEMCQTTYMEEVAPYAYDETKASRVQPLLVNMVNSALAACIKCYEK